MDCYAFPLAGTPLLTRACETALASGVFDQVAVLCDPAHAALVPTQPEGRFITLPAPVRLPTTGTPEGLVVHTLAALHQLQPSRAIDAVALLSPLFPLRHAADIARGVEMLDQARAAGVSVRPVNSPWRETADGIEAVTSHMGKILEETDALIYATAARWRDANGWRFAGPVLPLTSHTPPVRTMHDLYAASDALRAATLASARQRLGGIDLLIFDFDGVFTPNQVMVMQDGQEGVMCSRSDGLGLTMLRERGMQVAVLTAEMNPVVLRRCEKLKLPCLQVPRDKKAGLLQMLGERAVAPARVCYVGNDINDIPCMEHVGLAVAVADAYPQVKAAAHLVTTRNGGFGAVREVVDWFLEAPTP